MAASAEGPYATRLRRKYGVEDELNRYVSALYEMLANVLRWLRPGGWLCALATPNAGSIVYRLFQDLPPLLQQFALFYVPHDRAPFFSFPHSKSNSHLTAFVAGRVFSVHQALWCDVSAETSECSTSKWSAWPIWPIAYSSASSDDIEASALCRSPE